MKKFDAQLKIDGKKIAVSNLNKILYPDVGFTKGDVIDYYIKIAPFLLPHLKNRPLTLKRYPEGVKGLFFYEKRCPPYRPSWVKTATVWSSHNKANIDYCVINDTASLVWAVNLADLELHSSLSTKNPERPTMMVFDLDPGLPADVMQCAEIALHIQNIFKTLKLASFVKTSGSKGLQVYVPLNTQVTYDETKKFARAIAIALEDKFPKLVVSKMEKRLRAGKVFVDWSQNDNHKTTICVYSLRAKDKPTVSTPLKWEEVKSAVDSNKKELLIFETKDVLLRVKKGGDLFLPVLKLKQKLPKFSFTS